MAPSRNARARVEFLCLFALLILGLMSGATWSWRRTAQSTSPADAINDLTELVGDSNITPPSPAFDPADVVRLQLVALSRLRDNPQAVAECYSFASPANRKVTGPITRFARMVLGSAYRPLVTQQQALVGIPNVKGNRAVVLASVIDADRNLSIYCFYLSKQTDGAFRDCWMTDSVLPVPPMDELPSKGQPDPRPESV
ncbi:MAG: DUF4864 domain-containing protein [Pirellulales bacterium]